jgi:hypothetical protein
VWAPRTAFRDLRVPDVTRKPLSMSGVRVGRQTDPSVACLGTPARGYFFNCPIMALAWAAYSPLGASFRYVSNSASASGSLP